MSSILQRQQLEAARRKLWAWQKKHNYFPEINIVINDKFFFNFKNEEMQHNLPTIPEPYLKCYIDESRLDKMLARKLHWNDMEVGCHILFDRRPNVYMPDVHTLMSHFHI